MKKTVWVFSLIVMLLSQVFTPFTYAVSGDELPVLETVVEEVVPESEVIDSVDTPEIDNLTGNDSLNVDEISSWDVVSIVEPVDVETNIGVAVSTWEETKNLEEEEVFTWAEASSWFIEKITETIKDFLWINWEEENFESHEIYWTWEYEWVKVEVYAQTWLFASWTELTIEPVMDEKLEAVQEVLLSWEVDLVEEQVIAFDITFRNPKTQKELQPRNWTVQVKFNYEENESLVQAEENEEQEVKVYHLNDIDEDWNKIEELTWTVVEEIVVNQEESEEENIMLIEAESFSVYTIVVQVREEQLINFEYWMISIADPSNSNQWITMMDRNLWATMAWTWCGITDLSTCWYHYQRWNNYWFDYLKSSQEAINWSEYQQKIDVSQLDEYSSSSFISWDPSWTTTDKNLWWEWWQWPCPKWWHVPTKTEWNTLYTYYRNTYVNSWIAWFRDYFMLPLALSRSAIGATISTADRYGSYWSSSPHSSYIYAYNLTFTSSSVDVQNYSYRANGVSVRCFRNSYEKTEYHTISFDYKWWKWSVTSINVEDNMTWIKPLDPQREFSIFSWWFLSWDIKFDFMWTRITKDVELYAKWDCIFGYENKWNRCIKSGNWKYTTLVPWNTFNTKLKTLASNSTVSSYETPNSSIKEFKRANELTLWSKDIISTTDSQYPIYAWYDNWIIYYYTDAWTIYLNSDSSQMFREFNWLVSTDFDSFDTSKVINMKTMFYNCYKLEEIDVSNFDTRNVTNMGWMFYNCNNLKYVDVSNFDTSKVTNMKSMFYECNNLIDLDVSNFDTRNVTNMWWMFRWCKKLQVLNVSHFDTSKVTDMQSMFESCNYVGSLDVSNFDTRNVTNMGWMFFSCYKLQELNLSNFDTSNVTSMKSMFYSCHGFKSLDLSSFDTSNVSDMTNMFYNMYNLRTIYVSKYFNTNKVTQSNNMFYNNSRLVWWNGTTYSSSYINKTRAVIDKTWIPWYFTQKYVVSFDTNWWDSVNNQYLAYGEKADRPSDPKKNLSIFSWWYKYWTDEEFDFENTIITEDINLYAKWESIKITFNSSWWIFWDWTNKKSIDSQFIYLPKWSRYQTEIFTIPWAEELILDIIISPVCNDKVVFSWLYNSVNWGVYWSPSGEFVSHRYIINWDTVYTNVLWWTPSCTANFGGTIYSFVKNPIYEWKDFDWWYTENWEKWDIGDVVEGDIEVFAHWKDPITIKFDANWWYFKTWNVIINSIDVVYSRNDGIYSSTLWNNSLQIPNRKNYMFAGWYSTQTNQIIERSWVVDDTTESQTIYAKWLPFNDLEFELWWKKIIIMDRNLWAEAVANWIYYGNWNYESLNKLWFYYQWWNNYWFKNDWNINSNYTKIAWDQYWPWNYYYNNVFIKTSGSPYRWTTNENWNLWWWKDSWRPDSDRQWPCPVWYHVPTQNEWYSLHNSVFNYLKNTSEWRQICSELWNDGSKCFASLFKLPYAWYRSASSSEIWDRWTTSYHWSSTPYYSSEYQWDRAYFMYNYWGTLTSYRIWTRSTAMPVRCFKDNKVNNIVFNTNWWSEISNMKTTRWWEKEIFLPESERDFSVFMWWYLSENFDENTRVVSTSVDSNDDIILYAKFKCKKWYTESLDWNSCIRNSDTELSVTYHPNWWAFPWMKKNDVKQFTYIFSWDSFEPINNIQIPNKISDNMLAQSWWMFAWWYTKSWQNNDWWNEFNFEFSKENIAYAKWLPFNDISVNLWNQDIVLMDRNLWAEQVAQWEYYWYYSITENPETFWYFYQRWNNHWFKYTDWKISNNYLISTKKIKGIWEKNLWPNNYYYSDIFVDAWYNGWSEEFIPNLRWWASTANSDTDKQWPCPVWYHIPDYRELKKLYEMYKNHNNQVCWNDIDCFSVDLKLPYAWWYWWDDTNTSKGGEMPLWTSTPGANSNYSYFFYKTPSFSSSSTTSRNAFPIRCFKNSEWNDILSIDKDNWESAVLFKLKWWEPTLSYKQENPINLWYDFLWRYYFENNKFWDRFPFSNSNYINWIVNVKAKWRKNPWYTFYYDSWSIEVIKSSVSWTVMNNDWISINSPSESVPRKYVFRFTWEDALHVSITNWNRSCTNKTLIYDYDRENVNEDYLPYAVIEQECWAERNGCKTNYDYVIKNDVVTVETIWSSCPSDSFDVQVYSLKNNYVLDGINNSPNKLWYTFSWWYETWLNKLFDFTWTEVTKDRTLYAKWIPNTYTIHFDINWWTWDVSDIDVIYWQETKLPVVSKKWYIFGWWKTEDWIIFNGFIPEWKWATTENWVITTLTANRQLIPPVAWWWHPITPKVKEQEHEVAEQKQEIKKDEQLQEQTNTSEKTNPQQSSSSSKDNTITVDPEVQSAYEWAYVHDVTTISSLDEANPEWVVKRWHLAKMVVNYATNILWQEIPEKIPSECKWNDNRKDWESEEIKDYAVKSCALWLMWLDMSKFLPNMQVTRAQFGTIMSRLLWWKKYAWWTPYYRKHLNALKENWIMTQIDNPERRVELRQWVWLMLMRSAQNK